MHKRRARRSSCYKSSNMCHLDSRQSRDVIDNLALTERLLLIKSYVIYYPKAIIGRFAISKLRDRIKRMLLIKILKTKFSTY